jgi:hypothetical protein
MITVTSDIPADPRRLFRAGRAESAPAHVLATTRELLVAGGDDRIAIDPATGTNKYGCRAQPDETLLSFASATASAPSRAGFAAAERLRARLRLALKDADEATVYGAELMRLAGELKDLNGLASLPGVRTVLASSGTDLHLIAARQVFRDEGPRGLVLMVEASETGSGVRAALGATHFNAWTCRGQAVHEGRPIDGRAGPEVRAVALRGLDGTPRPCEHASDDVEQQLLEAVAQGRSVMVVLTDQSRSGLIAPDPERALDWRRRFPDHVHVLIDACQLRLAPNTFRAYVDAGFMVAITGSKFFGGPPFSGALLVPESAAHVFDLPAEGLGGYSLQGEWPASCRGLDRLGRGANWGLLLRWEAALPAMRRFRAQRDDQVGRFMGNFAADVSRQLAGTPCLQPVPSLASPGGVFHAPGQWDLQPSIFPFLLVHPGTRQPLDRAATLEVHRAVAMRDAGRGAPGKLAQRCQFSQPIPMGERDGVPVSALRLCLSADQASTGAADEAGAAAILDQAALALDKLAWCVGRLSGGDRVAGSLTSP